MIVSKAYDCVKEYLPIKLNSNIMRMGSIMPDIAPHRRIKLHNQSTALNQCQIFINHLRAKRHMYSFAYAAGVMSHYVSDCFCYAHNYYVLDLSRHRNYEVIMQKNIGEFLAIQMDINDIFTEWSVLQNIGTEFYLKRQVALYETNMTHLDNMEDRILRDIKLSIIYSAVLMLEIASILSPELLESEDNETKYNTYLKKNPVAV